MIAVTGFRTSIVRALASMVGDRQIERIDADLSRVDCAFKVPKVDRFVLAAGVLTGRPMAKQSPDEILTSIAVNLVNVVRLCETILAANDRARICVIGSESGFKGSFDETYALAKAAVHRYVETRKLGPQQQLVAVAPHIIIDSGMTERRHDFDALLRERDAGRKFTTAAEVAQCVRFLLCSEIALNNTVLRMTPTC